MQCTAKKDLRNSQTVGRRQGDAVVTQRPSYVFRRLLVIGTLAVALTLTATLSASAQDVYQTPPETLAKLVDAPATPGVSISPDEQMLLVMSRPGLPTIGRVAAPELRLAGTRINPNNFGPSRARATEGLSLTSLDGRKTPITGIPLDGGIRNVSWSPTSKHIAFTVDEGDKIILYLADAATGTARRLSDTPVNNTLGGPLSWWPDGSAILIRTVPEGIGSPPARPTTPSGPIVQDNEGKVAPARTYQDLLANSHDEALFKYYFTSELVKLSVDGAREVIGEPAIYRRAAASPNGDYVLVEKILEPFSYIVPYSRFPKDLYVLGSDGTTQNIASLPLAEDVPTGFGSVPTGPRSMGWRADAPATLYWVEAADGGDANVEAEVRDKMVVLEAPFNGEPILMASLALRYGGVQWIDSKRALISERWSADRTTRTHVYNPSNPGDRVSTLFDRSTEDRYGNPGRAVTHVNKYGRSVVRTTRDGASIYLTGTGASPEGNRPFLRTMNLQDHTTSELFRSQAPYYEYPVALLDNGRLITQRESANEPPNYFLRNGKKEPVALTSFPHPYPEMLGLQRETIRYKRADGLDLSAVLYLPKGYDKERDGPLPGLVWAYPREYKDASAAGQRSDSPYQFTRVSYWGAIPYVTQGYAIIDNASMPIIGEGDLQPNDVFREQLVANAQAAVDEGARRGVLDPTRVAIGGHSYGAFMTANLLAHSDIFKAGIARSGAYNRTLTPFGFQSEERTYWEAPEIYYGMSPFMHADKVNEPILMIHGEADNNSGTFPVQSRRYFAALKGLGKTARLVMLPAESHGYRARESIMHMLWETNRWLDLHVANPKPVEVKEVTG